MSTVKLASEMYADGYGYADLTAMMKAGKIRQVRRGAYSLDGPADATQEAIHLDLVRATHRLVSDEAVVSHMSAAVLHGLPTWNSALTKAHFTRDREGGGRTEGPKHIHVAPLRESDVVVLDGLRVTSVARTVCDLARSLTPFKAVPIGDAALARGVARAELAEALARCKGWRGVVRGRRTVEFLDPRSESPGESCSRVRIAEVGLPAPELQHEVFDDLGYLVGRADFAWLSQRTLGEFDGAGKYEELRRPDQTREDVLAAQHAREEALRDRGWQVARWRWEHLNQTADLCSIIRTAFDQADRISRQPR